MSLARRTSGFAPSLAPGTQAAAGPGKPERNDLSCIVGNVTKVVMNFDELFSEPAFALGAALALILGAAYALGLP